MYENGRLAVLNISDVLPNRFQPRIRFDEVKLNELAESIHKYGVIQPIVVRPINNKYEIIAGERRYKASKLANRATIPAIIVNLSDKDSEEIALLENIQRQELTAIEEAVSYKRILDMGYITQEALAKKLGKSQSTIANKIRLLNLDDQVQDALLHAKISERHARSLLKLSRKQDQTYMLNRIIKERLTVKRTDDEINKFLSSQPGGEQKVIPNKPVIFDKESVAEDLFAKNVVQETPAASHALGAATPKEPVKEVKVQEIDSFAPEERGENFMDIDKILKEAQDINVPENPKQPNDISELMKQDETTVMPAPTPVAPVQPQNNISETNKFINFQEPITEKPAEVRNDTNNGVSFDSIFNQKPINPEPINPSLVTPQPERVMEPVQPDVFTQSAPVQNVVPEPVKDIMPEPAREIIQPSVQGAPVFPEPIDVVPTPEPIREPIAAEPVAVHTMGFNKPETPAVSNIPDSEILETPSSMPSSVEAPVKQVQSPEDMHKFRQVINMIRSCADQVEKLGYYIDVDEIDMGESYQVTFKINK